MHDLVKNFIALEVGEYLDIHLLGGEYHIYTPPMEQSDWSECHNYGTII